MLHPVFLYRASHSSSGHMPLLLPVSGFFVPVLVKHRSIQSVIPPFFPRFSKRCKEEYVKMPKPGKTHLVKLRELMVRKHSFFRMHFQLETMSSKCALLQGEKTSTAAHAAIKARFCEGKQHGSCRKAISGSSIQDVQGSKHAALIMSFF